MKSRNPKYKNIAVLIIGVAIGLGFGVMQYMALTRHQTQQNFTVGQTIGAPLLLHKTDGTALTPESFKNRIFLVFFGFTHCPAFCPTALTTITDALAKLPPEKRSKLDVYFVTVDPERDTPQVLAEYMQNFDPAMTGLYGNADETAQVVKDWHVYVAKVPQGKDDYTVDHSTYLYLVDGNDFKLRHVFQYDDSVETLAAALNKEL